MRSTLIAAIVLALAAPAALAHPERKAYFPDGSVGAVPKYRTTAGQVLVVCKRTRRSGSGVRSATTASSAASA
jgi:hypothetical protein